MTILPKDFYLNNDVLQVSKNLLGKYLCTKVNGKITSGMIIETEGYKGIEDKACHAYMGKKTQRNEAMFFQGGIAYVYVCYGIHNLLNVVTNKKDIPDAVLIRAIKPIMGIDIMLKRRNKQKLDKFLASGPGSLTKALGIDKGFNKKSFIDKSSNHKQIWIEDMNFFVSNDQIIVSRRIGIDYAEEYAHKLWRYRIKDNLEPIAK
jgi:DNA-3-methyladenine glycosylase